MLHVKQDISKKNKPLVIISNWFIIRIYRGHLKHCLQKKRNLVCSFYPDCSQYGLLALKKYGFFVGWLKTIKRILKCNTYKHKNSCVDYP